MQTSFREFLFQAIEKDGAYKFLKPTIRKIDEMALYGDVSRMPINIDKDDIDFLKQFPHQYWPEAMHQRYQYLFHAIKKQHETRKAMGWDELEDAIIDAMKTGDYSKLETLEEPLALDKKEIEKIKEFKPEYTATLEDDEIEKIADKIAWEHLKKSTDFVDDPETLEFSFKEKLLHPTTGKPIKTRTQRRFTKTAKPFLNRLYHKIERTAGLPHISGSGLEGEIAKYGYDLRNPIEDPEGAHATTGFAIPKLGAIKDRMRAFMNLNAHSMFGKIDDPDVVWKPVNAEDSETAEQYLNVYRKEFEAQLKKNKNLTMDQVQSQARKLSKEKLAEKFPNGTLRGPAYPGVEGAENGFPVTFKRKENGEIQVINPPLYMPFKKMPNGELAPYPEVKSAHFYRPLRDSEYVRDDQGNKVKDENGNFKTTVNPEKLTGHKKDHVKIDDDEFQYGIDIQKDAAIDPNHNTQKKDFLVRGTSEYEEAFSKVFANQSEVDVVNGRMVDAPHSGLYRDIIQGILNCVRNKCGDMTDFEAAIMMQNISQIHGLIYMSMLESLNLKKQARSLSDKNNRVEWAFKKASSYAQKDHGGGTRRLRALSDAARATQTRRHTTRRRFDTSGMKFPYRIENYNKFLQDLADLRERAAKADAEAKQAVAAVSRRRSASEGIGNLLTTSLQDRAKVADDLVLLLAVIHQEFGEGTTDSQKYAEDTIKSFIEQGMDSIQLVTAFQNLDVVKKAKEELKVEPDVGSTEEPKVSTDSDMQREIRDANNIFGNDFNIDLQRVSGNKQHPEILSKYKATISGALSRYVSTELKQKIKGEHQWLSMPEGAEDLDKVLKAVQKAIDERMAMPELPRGAETGGQARVRIGTDSGKNWFQNLQSQTPEGYFHVAHDPIFHKRAPVEKLKDLKNYFNQNADKFHPEDHASALNALDAAIREKKVTNG